MVLRTMVKEVLRLCEAIYSPLTLLNTVRISAFARTFLPRVDSLNTLESETPPLVKIYGTVDIKKVCNIMANEHVTKRELKL